MESHTNKLKIKQIKKHFFTTFQRNVSVKIDSQTNRLIGLPDEWADIFKKNNIDTTLNANQLKPIFKAYERSVHRKGFQIILLSFK